MNYDLKKAVDRFQFRFSKENGEFKTFKPNQIDVEAINTIFEWIDRQKKENVLNNVVLAKLYIYQKTMNLRYYGTTVLDNKYNFADTDMVKLLRTPLYLFYESFYNDLHNNQLPKNDEKLTDEIIKDYHILKKTYTLEMVTSKLNDEISEVINKFSDSKLTDYKPSNFGK